MTLKIVEASVVCDKKTTKRAMSRPEINRSFLKFIEIDCLGLDIDFGFC